MNFYELLGLNNNASLEEIEQAYRVKLAELYAIRNTGTLSDEEYNKRMSRYNKAFNVLSNEDERAQFDEYLARKANGTGSRGPQHREPKKSRKGLVKGLKTGAICVAVAASVAVAGYFGLNFINHSNRPSISHSQSQDSGTITPGENGVVTPSQTGNRNTQARAANIVNQLNDAGLYNADTNEPYTVDEVEPVVEYLDSFNTVVEDETKNDASLQEKATNIVNQLTAANLVNAKTGQSYTVDEIMDVVQYIDGVYNLEGNTALNLVSDFLNVVIAPVKNEQLSPNNTNTNNGNNGSMSGIVNYGNINDEQLLNTRATNLVNQLNAAGLYNFKTNAPYTVDEIKEVILYVNGVYDPKDEVEAMSKVDDFLNLALAPLNSETFIYTVAYQSGEESFKPMVEENIKNFKRVNFVDNLLFGDSTVGPYLKWLEDQYCAMQTTTDREECNRIYNSVLQSLAEFSFGNGFELDGKVYKEGMALGLDKVNSGNVLQFLVYIIEPFRTAKANDYYTITDKFLSADPEENTINVPYLQISEWYTPLCDYDTYQFDDEGYLLIDQVGVPEAGIEERIQSGHNFASINQMNTINALLEQLYGKNIQADRTLNK